MWPFEVRSAQRRVARARQMYRNGDYLNARQEVEGIEDPEAVELYKLATDHQVERVLAELAASKATRDDHRAKEFMDIARRLGASRERIDAAIRGGKPVLHHGIKP